jgi:hypothetical protein
LTAPVLLAYSQLMLASDASQAAVPLPSAESEAARYALLRRLAPSMRHHLVVNLQPIGMIYEVMERRLRVPAPDLAHVHESANKINGFARAALNSCLDVVGWLSPDDTVTVPPHEAARECAALLATSLSFRGYALRNQVEPVAGSVRRSAIRCLLTAMLIHATDHHAPGAELVVTARPEADGVLLEVLLRASDTDRGFANEPGYRKLEWRDVQALAAAEGAQVERSGDTFRIRLPWMSA